MRRFTRYSDEVSCGWRWSHGGDFPEGDYVPVEDVPALVEAGGLSAAEWKRAYGEQLKLAEIAINEQKRLLDELDEARRIARDYFHTPQTAMSVPDNHLPNWLVKP